MQLTRYRHEAHGGEDNHLATAMDPWSNGGLLTHHSGGWHGDEEGLRWWFPYPAGCWEELLDPPDLKTTTVAVCIMFRGKMFLPIGFLRWRKFIGGDVSRCLGGLHHLVAWPGGGSRHPMVRPPPSPPPSLLWTSSLCQVNRNFGFHFIPFQEYFLCNFSETQK
jgi:hypothetical protein